MANFNLKTNYTTGANRERINLYLASAPTAVVDSLTYNPPHVGGHTWAFFNLIPSENYRFDWIEIDSNGNMIRPIDSGHFTVPAYGSVETKTTSYLIADTTPGVYSGFDSFTMDGSNGTDDWRGWAIKFEKKGFGTEFPGIEYSYNIATGKVTLTNADGSAYLMEPGERFTVGFENKIVPTAPVVVSGSFAGIKHVTTNEQILETDFGKNLIQVDGLTDVITVTLPVIGSVAANRPLIIKSGRGNHTNVRVQSLDPNTIDWLYGAMTEFYLGRIESVHIYRQVNNGFNSWQVVDACGNFMNVGMIVEEYSPLANTFNKVAADATIYNVNKHARLYDYILRLPPGETVSFAGWSADTRKFSLANGSGQFHVPDLRNLYARASDGTNAPGTYQADMVGPITAHYNVASNQNANGALVFGRGGSDIGDGPVVFDNTGTETRPKTYITRKYILC